MLDDNPVRRTLPMLSLILLSSIGPALADVPKAALTPEQRQQVVQLLTEFRRTRNEPQKRDAALDKLLAIGGPAVTQVQGLIKKELQSQLKLYATKFRSLAEGLYRRRATKANVAEVAQLRTKVLSLKDRDNLTKEMIVAEGDPAIERLRELLVISREAVLENAALQEQRAALLQTGGYWQRCKQYLADHEPQPDEDGRSRSFEDYLHGEEEMAVQLAMPIRPQNRSVLTANAQLAPKLDPEEARAIAACNLLRNLLGLNVLSIDLKLCAASRDHSADMERLKFFSHSSPVPGKESPWDRAKQFGTSASAENIFTGGTDGNAVNAAWFHSPGHHKNMLSPHRRIGIGRSGGFYTEMFGN